MAGMEDEGRGFAPGAPLTPELFWEAVPGGEVEVVGTSMEPLVPRGARVRLRPLPGPLPLGSLVLFSDEEGFVVHRVVARPAQGLRTKGDRAFRSDPPARSPGEVLGVVAAVESGGRRAEMEGLPWRIAGLFVAWNSRLWDLLAAPFPVPWLSGGGGLAGRILRKSLRIANGWLPWIASRSLARLWRETPARPHPRGGPRPGAGAREVHRDHRLL